MIVYGLRLSHYPNNELRLTAFPISGGRFCFEGDENENDSHSVESTIDTEDSAVVVDCEENLPGKGGAAPLSLPPNSELSLRPGFGGLPRKSSFTLNGKRQIMRCGGAVEKAGFQKENCLFLTGTLAGSTVPAMEALARWSGWVVDRLKSWMSKYAQNRHEFYVWELQKRGALHLHYFVALDELSQGVPILERFHSEWRKLLLRVSEMSGVDVFERAEGGTWKDDETKPKTDAQRVTHSVCQYMAKYCSKGSGANIPVSFCPSRWWGASRPLLGLLRSLTSVAESVFPNINSARKKLEEMLDYIESKCDIVHSYSSLCKLFKVTVGYHLPSWFGGIQSKLRESRLVECLELRDGSQVRTSMGLRQRMQFLHDILPHSPMLAIAKRELADFLYKTGKILKEKDLDWMIDCLEKMSFLDTGLSAFTVDCKATDAELNRVSRHAWQTSRYLVDLRKRCFLDVPVEDSFQSELPQSQRVVTQLTVWGTPAIDMIPWHD